MGKDHEENTAIIAEFERLKLVSSERKVDEKIHLKDFCKNTHLTTKNAI